MFLYRLEVLSDTSGLISLSKLPNYISISSNLHLALTNLFRTCFNNGNLGVHLPSIIYFIVVQNTIASVAMVTTQGPHTGYMIYNACTGPAFRKRGLMSKLIQQIILDFTGKPIYLQVKSYNQQAYDLYVKLGFTPVNITGEIITMKY